MPFVCPTCGCPRSDPAEVPPEDRHTRDDTSECHHEMYGVAVPAVEVEEGKVPRGIRHFDADLAHLPEGWRSRRCTDCGRRFGDGDRYAKSLDSLAEDGAPVSRVVCLPCSARGEGGEGA